MVRSNEQISVHHVPAYSTHYPRHPRRVMTIKDGIMIVPSALDPFTSMSADVMRLRHVNHPFATRATVETHWRVTYSRMSLGTVAAGVKPPHTTQVVSSETALQAGGKNAGGTKAKHLWKLKGRKLRSSN